MQRPAGDRDDGCVAFPSPGKQLHRVEPDGDEDVRVLEHLSFQSAIGEHARKPRMPIGHDTFRLVGHEGGMRPEARSRAARPLSKRAPQPDQRTGRRALPSIRSISAGSGSAEPRRRQRRSRRVIALFEAAEVNSTARSRCTGPGGGSATASIRLAALEVRHQASTAARFHHRREDGAVGERLMLHHRGDLLGAAVRDHDERHAIEVRVGDAVDDRGRTGSRVARHAPGAPVSSAWAVAMKADADSVWASENGRCACVAASSDQHCCPARHAEQPPHAHRYERVDHGSRVGGADGPADRAGCVARVRLAAAVSGPTLVMVRLASCGFYLYMPECADAAANVCPSRRALENRVSLTDNSSAIVSAFSTRADGMHTTPVSSPTM